MKLSADEVAKLDTSAKYFVKVLGVRLTAEPESKDFKIEKAEEEGYKEENRQLSDGCNDYDRYVIPGGGRDFCGKEKNGILYLVYKDELIKEMQKLEKERKKKKLSESLIDFTDDMDGVIEYYHYELDVHHDEPEKCLRL